MPDAQVVEWIRHEYVAVVSELGERARRRWAAAEARSLGWGGISAVAQATGMSDRTIRNGIKEIESPDLLSPGRQRKPIAVKTHDFPDKELGKAVPCGVYDLTRNEAGVSVGIGHDTAEFAVAAIRRWWKRLGQKRYPSAKRLLITADSGGSNSPRTRLWRWELQHLADETGMIIEVCHYPPGTSKWNKIEHRLFCHITRNWRGVPLETLEIVVSLIGATTTEQGLEVHAWLDGKKYQKGRKVSDADLAEVYIKRNKFHGDWNYEIHPRSSAGIR